MTIDRDLDAVLRETLIGYSQTATQIGFYFLDLDVRKIHEVASFLMQELQKDGVELVKNMGRSYLAPDEDRRELNSIYISYSPESTKAAEKAAQKLDREFGYDARTIELMRVVRKNKKAAPVTPAPLKYRLN